MPRAAHLAAHHLGRRSWVSRSRQAERLSTSCAAEYGVLHCHRQPPSPAPRTRSKGFPRSVY
eukprot:scaffold49090_cov53-Phaeocystis_antarctica.AAC.3